MDDTAFRLRVEEVFNAVEDLSASERSRYLDEHCADEPQVRAEVESLLSMYDSKWMEDSVPPPESPRFRPGDVAGDYKIIRPLGEGGMGVVYWAEQLRPVRRPVALKVLKRSFGRDVVQRFEGERQNLAVLNHPNIAAVYGAGTLPNTYPYFVMEIVGDSDPITAYCDVQKLTVPERLELFVQICEGLEHAHQKGIVHRDIKPSNILVGSQGGRPVVKIIDFGVAQALGPILTDSADMSPAAVVGTLPYMSPEQARPGPSGIDTRADIYSAGVLLHELLCGELPFESDDLRELIRLIVEMQPVPPSRRVVEGGTDADSLSLTRRLPLPKLRRMLKGDLDNIVSKALSKDRTQRYRTATDLADDIRRYLRGDPVTATPPTVSYVMRKMVLRKKGTVAAVSAVALLVVGLAASMTLQASRVSRERDRANGQAHAATRVSDFLVQLFQEADPGKGAGSEVTVREMLDQASAKIRGDLRDEPAVQARLMETIGRSYLALGLYPAAREHLERARNVRLELYGPGHHEVARSLESLGTLSLREGNLKDAGDLLNQALELQRRLLGARDPDLGATLNNLGSLELKAKRNAEALPLLLEALEIREVALGAQHPENAKTLNNIGTAEMKLERLESAERYYQQALEIREQHFGADHPEVATSVCSLGDLHRKMGDLHRDEGDLQREKKELREAAPLLQRCLAMRERALGVEHPRVAHGRWKRGRLLISLAATEGTEPEERAELLQQARSLYEGAIAIWEKVLEPSDETISTCAYHLAVACWRLDERADADRWFAKALELDRTWHPEQAKQTAVSYVEFLREGSDERRARQLEIDFGLSAVLN